MPTVSVIVPVYKVEEFLPRCVDSLLAQTFTDFELWLVDDGSPDRCGEICDEYAKKDSRIRVIHKENGGLSDARNVAIDRATGEYLAFVDSDDWVSPTFLESMITALKETDADMAVCNFVAVYDDGSRERMYIASDEREVLEGDRIFETLLQPSACNKCYRASIFKTLRYPVGRLYEDAFIYHDILAQTKRIVCTGEDAYFYYLRSGSIMHTSYNIRFTDIIDVIALRAAALDKMGQPILANEARLFGYSQVAVAYAHLDKKDPKEAERLSEIQTIYEGFYPKLMADKRISVKQKLRLWMLRYMPGLHTALFGKRMPINLGS
ncbi:MAG: glycosyltransferase [Clostridia bacterium]|nr:glycosyltransferase [Clostridia bacterium]